MPMMNGLECLDRIMLQRPTPVVMVSTLTEEGADATLDALRLGAVDFVSNLRVRYRCDDDLRRRLWRRFAPRRR